jgi:hypothetical protein
MSTRRRFENLQVLLEAIEKAKTYVNLPPSILNAVHDVQEEFKDELKGDAINISWHIDDVKALGHESGFEDENELTDEECRDILTSIERKHDATIGINWDVIQVYIDDKG